MRAVFENCSRPSYGQILLIRSMEGRMYSHERCRPFPDIDDVPVIPPFANGSIAGPPRGCKDYDRAATDFFKAKADPTVGARY